MIREFVPFVAITAETIYLPAWYAGSSSLSLFLPARYDFNDQRSPTDPQPYSGRIPGPVVVHDHGGGALIIYVVRR